MTAFWIVLGIVIYLGIGMIVGRVLMHFNDDPVETPILAAIWLPALLALIVTAPFLGAAWLIRRAITWRNP